jgi:hypothetical protein
VSYVMAKSGSLPDIRDAVNQALQQGIKLVFVPGGSFLYDANGEDTLKVNVPATGLTIIGLGTEIHLAPATTSHLPGTAMMIFYGLSGGKLNISGFEFNGRGESNVDVGCGDTGISIINCRDFRVHHNKFGGKFGGSGVNAWGTENYAFGCRGVVDHCTFSDIFVQKSFDRGTGFSYGVACNWYYYAGNYLWEPDIKKIAGHYDDLPYCVYIEDCEFSGCRHAVVGFQGAIYVFRHNRITDFASYMSAASIDQHPYRLYEPYTADSGRWCEVYDNELLMTNYSTGGFYIGGGGGLWFRNRINVSGQIYTLIQGETSDDRVYPRCAIRDLWIWDNDAPYAGSGMSKFYIETRGRADPVFYEREPTIEELPLRRNAAGRIEPYPYPHPLTLEEQPPQNMTPWTGTLEEGTYKITVPQQVQVGSDIYNFKQWEDGSTNPVRTISLTADMTITATYEQVVTPPKPPILKWLAPAAFITVAGAIIHLGTKEGAKS